MFSNARFGDLVGRRLKALSVIKLREVETGFRARPNEMGLCFSFEGGGRMVASHLLHETGDDNFVVVAFDDLPESTRRNIYEIPIS